VLRLLVKLNGAEHIPMVCHCKGRHLVFPGKAEEVVMPYCAVKKTVLCMQMQMDKIRVLHG
jgi:hypothetical protein